MTGKSKYSIDDLVHDGKIYDALNKFDFDLAFYKKWCKKADMRCFWPREMDAILKYNGFEVVHKFGNFDESEFKSGAPKQIYVLKAKK